MQRAISAADAAALIPDGASVMFGGFMGVGSPDRIIDALVARGARGLTIIGNDTAFPGVGVGKLIDAGCVAQARVIAYRHEPGDPEKDDRRRDPGRSDSARHAGRTHPRRRQRPWRHPDANRCWHSGGKGQKGHRDRRARAYLLELPMRADFALIRAREADYNCNLTYRLTATNFNPLIAFAADCVIAEPDEIVPVGVIPPDAVRTPGILVHHLVERPH